ncbi:uncharacterized protein LOC144120422 isoform X3 [Amblyomma americanum]
MSATASPDARPEEARAAAQQPAPVSSEAGDGVSDALVLAPTVVASGEEAPADKRGAAGVRGGPAAATARLEAARPEKRTTRRIARATRCCSSSWPPPCWSSALWPALCPSPSSSRWSGAKCITQPPTVVGIPEEALLLH